MYNMFRKFAKGPEQSLSIICKDFIYNSYFGKVHQKLIPVIPRKALIVGFRSVNLDAVSQLYQKTLHHSVLYFGILAHFLRIGIKNSSNWIAQNMFSKEVKQVLQKRGRGTGVVMELLKKTNRAISKTLL